MSGCRFVVLSSVVALIVGGSLSAAPVALAAKPTPPAAVTAAKAGAVTASTAAVSWSNPSAHFASTVVRVAKGATAPTSPAKGTAVATVKKPGHAAAAKRLAAETAYTFALFSSDGKGHYGKRVVVHTITAPAGVSHLAGTSTDASITLTWSNPSAATFSNVVVRYAKGTEAPAAPTKGSSIALAAAKANSGTVSSLLASTGYAFGVWTKDKHGHYSAEAKLVVTTRTPVADTTPPGPVTAPSAVATSSTSVSLAWTNPTDTDFVGVKICRAASGAVSQTATCTALVDTAKPLATFMDATAAAGTSYVYSLFAHDGSGNFAAAATATATTPPAPVTVLSAAANATGTQITLLWTDSTSASATGVKICRSAAGGPAPTAACPALQDVAKGVGTYKDTAVATGTNYTYALFAHDGTPAYSTAATVKVTTPVGAVTGLSATATASTITLAWTNPASPSFSGITVVRKAGSTAPTSLTDGTKTELGKVATFVDSSVTAATTYSYAVFAHDAANPVGYSVAATITKATSSNTTAPSIQGKVTNPSGVGIAGVDVYVTPHIDGLSSTGGSVAATTKSDGTYVVTSVRSGISYTVCFDPSNVADAPVGGYVRACRDRDVTPQSKVPTTGIDGQLTVGGSFTGKVTAATGGAGVAGVNVLVFDLSEDSLATTVGTATTTADGSYKLGGVPAATNAYAVCFDASAATTPGALGYLDQCYKNVAWDGGPRSASGAARLSSTAGTAQGGIDAALTAGSAISGTVTSSTGGKPLGGVNVFVYSLSDGNLATSLSSATTGSDGKYAAKGLVVDSGGYGVCFRANRATGGPSTNGYQNQCYKNVAWDGNNSPAHVTPVQVTASTTTTKIDAALSDAGAITGTVRPAVGNGALAGVDVTVYSKDGAYETDVETNASGVFRVPGLPPSSTGYFLCFDASEASGGTSAGGYLDQCYNGKPWDGNDLPDGVTLVPVPDTTTVTLKPVLLNAAAGISGIVTSAADNTPVAEVQVEIIQPAATGDDSPQAIGTAYTDSDGTYAATGLQPNATGYFVCFRADSAGGTSPAGYLSSCLGGGAWDEAENDASGTKVAATAGASTTANGSLGEAAGISGAATDSSAHGLSGVSVSVYDSTGGPVGYDTTGDGGYEVDGLTPGQYVVCFSADDATGGTSTTGYVSECYDNVAIDPSASFPPTGAKKVTTTAGSVTGNINASLAAAGAISGTVTTSGAGLPLSDVLVRVWASGGVGVNVANGYTAADGTYVVPGLTPGLKLTVCFDPEEVTGASKTGYAAQCYQGIAWDPDSENLPAGAKPVTTTAGATVPHIDAALMPAAGILGTVTAVTGGKSIPDLEVDVFSGRGGNLQNVASVDTSDDGTFVVGGLPPSTDGYLVCFAGRYATDGASPTGYVSECYDNVPWTGRTRDASGSRITLTAGQAVTITASLASAAAVGGIVTTAAAGHAPLGNVSVYAVDANGNTYAGDTTGDDGSYAITGLAPAKVYVCYDSTSVDVAPGSLGSVSRCVGGSGPWAFGDPPTAKSTTTTLVTGVSSSVSFAVPLAGGVSGTITDSAKKPLTGAQVYVVSANAQTNPVTTGANGAFAVTGLDPTTSYTVCADVSQATGGSSTSGYVSQCLGGVAFTPGGFGIPSGATTFTPTSGAVTTETLAVPAASAVVGKVTGPAPGNAGLAGVNVVLADANGNQLASATTLPNGTYRVPGLAAGSYYVCFDGQAATNGPSSAGYQDVCNPNIPWSGYDGDLPDGSKPVAVPSAGAATVNAVLAPGAGVSGVVTDGAGSGLGGVIVDLFDTNGSNFGTAFTTTDGKYTFGGLVPQGGVEVCFDPSQVSNGLSDTGYLSECWDNTPWRPSAGTPTGKSITLTAGALVPNTNAQLAVAGAISGTYSLPAGTSVGNLYVQAFDASGNVAGYGGFTDDGSYQIVGLPTGSYAVCAYEDDTQNVAGSCYKNSAYYAYVSPPATATKVAVSAGTTTGSINLTFAAGATLGGTVTGPTGQGVSDVAVEVFDATGTLVDPYSAQTGSDGTWTLDHLPAGTYRVCFDATSITDGATEKSYAGQCYQSVAWSPYDNNGNPQGPPSGTQAIALTAGKTVTGVNAKLVDSTG